MKLTFLLIAGLCMIMKLQAQVYKTIRVTSGGLSSSLTTEEKNTITNLTLAGNIDARDFKTMRDDMPVLAEIDLSSVTIEAYSGEGTIFFEYDFQANTVPDYAFFNPFTWNGNTRLISILLPNSITSIGHSSFSQCTGLQSVFIPSSVTSISDGAFQGCSGSINVDSGNLIYSSTDGILFDKLKTKLIQCPISKTENYSVPTSVQTIGYSAFFDCTSLSSVSIPNTVNTIDYSAFYNCSGLTSITIPSSLTSIGDWAFYNCIGLTTIYTQHENPIDLSALNGVFEGIDKSICKLYVPFGSSSLYATASHWQDFYTNIIEMPEFKLSANKVNIPFTGGDANINLATALSWSASSDKSWLNATPLSGIGNTTLTITAEANSSVGIRTVEVIVSANSVPFQSIIITQGGAPKMVNVTAGGLVSALTSYELSNTETLILNGTIDARDFKTMSYYMPGLKNVDLSETTVVAYSGTEGPDDLHYRDYPANEIPDYAFSRNLRGNPELVSIKMPSSVTAVGYAAFFQCTSLKYVYLPSSLISISTGAFSSCIALESIDFPSSLQVIGYGSFAICTALDSLILPNSLKSLGINTFSQCSGLKYVYIPESLTVIDNLSFNGTSGNFDVATGNPLFSSVDGILFNKDKTIILNFPSSKVGNYLIPSSVIYINSSAFANSQLSNITIPNSVQIIGSGSFMNCKNLREITIPNSITSIGFMAFFGNSGLSSIICQLMVPIDFLVYSFGVFDLVDKVSCTLYVPFGSKSAYQNAGQWKDFQNIVEMRDESTVCQTLTFKTGWNIFSTPNLLNPAGIETVFQPFITNNSLVKIQDEEGNTMEDWGIFGGWKNNIGDISAAEGYKIKVNRDDTLSVSGSPVTYPFAIPLKKGWNIAGYPQQTDFSGMNLVQQLADKGTLIKVQDEGGNSIEDWGIFGSWTNNIGNFMPGEGYTIKVSADDTLWIYESYPKSSAVLPEKVETSHFLPAFRGNGVDHMNINLVGLPIHILQVGDELAVFDGATCVGAVTLMPHHLHSQTVSIVASATDNQGIPGFVAGNPFVLKLWNIKNHQELKLEPEIVKGTSIFIRNETTIASLEKYAATGLEGLFASEQPEINCYPNPFSDEITIEINLFKETEVQVEVLNQLGQLVKYINTGEQLNRGIHRLIWDGTNSGKGQAATGIYLIRMKLNDTVYYRKVIYSK
jgi:hypothetical protein